MSSVTYTECLYAECRYPECCGATEDRFKRYSSRVGSGLIHKYQTRLKKLGVLVYERLITQILD
jgi:hypothetical protein